MNIVKQNQLKIKIARAALNNVSLLLNLFIQNNNTNTNNNQKNNKSNSIINSTKNYYINSLNNLFNKNIPSFKQNTSLKHYNIREKMYLNQQNNQSQKQINSNVDPFPNFLITKNNRNYVKYDILQPYNSINYKENNINMSENKKKIPLLQTNYINNNNNNIYNNLKMKMNNTHLNRFNSKRNYNHNFSYQKKNNSNTNKMKNNKNKVNTYIINTINISEKKYFRDEISSKFCEPKKSNRDYYQKEINKLIKEKEDCQNIFKKHEKLIEKMEEENAKLDYKIKNLEQENRKIRKQILVFRENEEQLIMLVKIIKKSGIDIEKIIVKYNEEVEKENNRDKSTINNDESIPDSINDLSSKNGISSFIPINIKEENNNKIIYKGIPKLNFDILKNNQKNNKRKKFINNSK